MDEPSRIPLETVESSNLSAVGYDPERLILAIQFKNGSIWHYGNVSMEMVTLLYASASRGSFFSKSIKGKFPAEKMSGRCGACGAHGYLGDLCQSCGEDVYNSEQMEMS